MRKMKETDVKPLHALLAALIALTGAQSAFAQVRIVTEGMVDQRIPVAVPPFAVSDPALSTVARELTDALAYDLEFTGLVAVLPPDEFPSAFTGFNTDLASLNLDLWVESRAEYLVYGQIHYEGDQLVGQFRLFDLASKDQLIGQELRVNRSYPRLAPHRFSEEIIRQFTGTAGAASSEIVFSAGVSGNKEIYVADYDGANARRLTEHNSISIKPKLSPDGSKIAYVSYKDRYSFLYIFDRATGQSVPLSREVGLNSAPAWAPNGRELAITLSKDGNTEIYLRDADGSNLRRLTRNRDGDTSPTFSPDGSRIAFVSDRAGSAQIYVMNRDGSNQVRLSHQGGASFDPAWSPDGRMIAYVVNRRGEGFQIYAMDADGSNPRKLTSSQGINESPSWSPDSRHIIYSSTRSGQKQLWTVNVESGEERQVPRLSSMSCEGPTWGPRRR